MNNILQFRDVLDFSSPDLKAMQLHKEIAGDHMITATVSHKETAYLPHLQQKIEALSKSLDSVHFMLPRTAQSISLDLEAKADRLRSFLVELTGTNNDQEREEIQEDIDDLLAEALVKSKAEYQKLSSGIGSLLEDFDRTPTVGYLAGHNKDIDRLVKDIEQGKKTLSELAMQRKTLTDAIEAIEKIGFEKMAMNTLLTAEGLDALDVAAPQAAVIKLAIDSMKQFIESIGSAMSYLGLTAARDVIVKRINEQQKIMDAKNNDIRLTRLRVNFIDAIHGFDDSRRIYIGELSKVIDALGLFMRSNTAMTASDQESVTKFVRDAQQLATYLNALQ